MSSFVSPSPGMVAAAEAERGDEEGVEVATLR